MNKIEEAYVSWTVDAEVIFDEDGEESTGADYVLIEKLYVPVAERGQGKARRMMNEALEEIRAEHPGLTIKVAALPFGDDALDMIDLVAFYESLGFEVSDTSGHAVIMEM